MTSPRNTLQEFFISRGGPFPTFSYKKSDDGWKCTINFVFEEQEYSLTGPSTARMKETAAETSLMVLDWLRKQLKYIDKDLVIAVDIENVPTVFKTLERHYNFSNKVQFVCFTSENTPSGLYVPDRCKQYKTQSSRKDAADVGLIMWCTEYDFTSTDELLIISKDKIMDTVKDCMTHRIPHVNISVLRNETSVVDYLHDLR